MATAFASPAPPIQMDGPANVFQEQGDNASFVEGDPSQYPSEEQWRAIAKIIHDVGPTLLPEEELGDLAAAESAINVKVKERDQIVDQLREDLRQLTRQHREAASAAKRPATHPTPEAHDAQVRQLESKQYSLGKALNEEQASVAKREAELGKAKIDKEEIAQKDIGEDDWVDGKALRLKILADAGFSFIPAKEDGTPAKILIRNDAKEDVHTVAVDKSKSKVHYANLLWSLASE